MRRIEFEMQSFHERKQENDHFGSTKLVAVDPSGDEILTLGEDDRLLNCFITESITLSSAHDLKILDGKNVNSFCFLSQSTTFLVAVENKIFSFNWPKCDIQKVIYEHDNEINLICATSSEDIVAISDDKNDVILLKYSGQNQYKLIQKVFSSPNSKIAWIDFGPLCDSLAIFTNDFSLTVINSKNYETIFTEKTTSFCLPCFTSQSDLLYLNDGKIISISQISKNSAVFQNKNHNPEITAIISSHSSNHIATYDTKGTITVSKYERSAFNYSREPDFDSPQELPFVLSIEHPSSKLTSLFWRYDIIASGDEEGALYFWEGVAGIPKPTHNQDQEAKSEDSKKSSNNTHKKKKGLSFIESLTAPVDPSRARKEDDEEVSLSEDEETISTKKKSKAQVAKPKKQPKKAKQQKKLTTKNFLQGEKISEDDDESEMEDFIESKEEFEERIKKNAPEPEPEPEPEFAFLESETSSDHDVDLDLILSPEEREKIQHQREEEEEKYEKMISEKLQSGISSDMDGENMDDLDDDDELDSFEFDHVFMPGNNDYFVGNRRYLCWNYYAAILLRKDREDETKTEIDIHTFFDDKTRSIPNINKYSLASIDENGIIFASKTDVFYEHHKTWAPDKTTSLQFHNEKVTLVACGEEWFAVATDTPSIRLFTSAGLEIGIIPIPLSCQVMVGRGKYLFYAHPNGSDLEYSIISVLKNEIVINNHIISVIRPIKWVGFDNNNKIYIQDRNNVIFILSKDFSWQWIPVLDLKDYFDTTTNNYWVVKAQDEVIYGVPLRSQRSPATYPIPKLHSLDTHLMTFDTEVRPWLAKKTIQDASKQKTDAELLKIFPSAIQSDHEFRAYHIAGQMKTNMARKFVVGYADKHNASIVADKLTGTDSKPQKKVLTISRENSEENRKRATPSRSSSTEQTVYVRKARNTTQPFQHPEYQTNQEDEAENENNDSEETAEKVENENENENESAEEEENNGLPGVTNSLFEALKKLGSKPTSIIAAKNDNGRDIVPKKKAAKKRSEPIVHRKRPRKTKKNDTSDFRPLFQ